MDSFTRLLVSALLAAGLTGCGSAPTVVETHKPGEESKLLEGIYYLTDAQVVALRAAGIPDGAILERDMVRAACGDDVVTLVLEDITEAQAKDLKENQDVLRPLLDPKSEVFKARSHFEGGKHYLSIGPIHEVKSVKARIRFGSITKIDDESRVVFVKYRAVKSKNAKNE
jgi:hypothetical protein